MRISDWSQTCALPIFLDLGIGGILDHSRGLRIRKLSFVGSISKECGTLGKFVILTLIGHITEFLGGESDSIEIDHTNPRLLGLTKQRLRRGELNSIQNVIPDCPLRVDQPDQIGRASCRERVAQYV